MLCPSSVFSPIGSSPITLFFIVNLLICGISQSLDLADCIYSRVSFNMFLWPLYWVQIWQLDPAGLFGKAIYMVCWALKVFFYFKYDCDTFLLLIFMWKLFSNLLRRRWFMVAFLTSQSFLFYWFGAMFGFSFPLLIAACFLRSPGSVSLLYYFSLLPLPDSISVPFSIVWPKWWPVLEDELLQLTGAGLFSSLFRAPNFLHSSQTVPCGVQWLFEGSLLWSIECPTAPCYFLPCRPGHSTQTSCPTDAVSGYLYFGV